MSRRTRLGAAGLALLAALYSGDVSYRGLSRAEAELHLNRSYARAVELGYIRQELSFAKDKLEYKPSSRSVTMVSKMPVTLVHPASYPDAKDARNTISRSVARLGDLGDIDDRLVNIHDSLPDQNDIQEYGGKPVGRAVFEGQKEGLAGVIGSIDEMGKYYADKVPEGLKASKNRYGIQLFFSILGGLGAIGYGIYTFLGREKGENWNKD